MKLYIAGKITGLDYNEAFAKFAKAAEELREMGHEPVNPMAENGLDGDGKEYPWAEYMKRGISHLLKCDGIYLLPCWVDSRGARLEFGLAVDLGMEVVFARSANQQNQ